MTARIRCALLGASLLIVSLGAAPAAPAKDAVSVFARVPDPGHPLGVGVDGDRVYVTTSAGLPIHVNTKGERLFTYTRRGRLVSTAVIDTGPVSNIGLFGIAFDGKSGAGHHVYVSDMNGRILRYAVDPRPSKPEVYAQTPLPYSAGGWYTSMTNDIAFDAKGNAYVTDDKPRLWRIPPGGDPEVWFEDPGIAGFVGVIGGPFGGRIGPDGKFYFAVTQAPGPDQEGVVFRLPLVEHPTVQDL